MSHAGASLSSVFIKNTSQRLTSAKRRPHGDTYSVGMVEGCTTGQNDFEGHEPRTIPSVCRLHDVFIQSFDNSS